MCACCKQLNCRFAEMIYIFLSFRFDLYVYMYVVNWYRSEQAEGLLHI